MGFSGSNLVNKHFIFKFVELVFIFIVFMIFRCGDGGDIFFWGKGTGVNFITTPPLPTTTTKPTTTTTASSTSTTTTTTTTTGGGRLAKVLGIGSLEDLEIELPEQEFDPYASSGAYNLPEQAENDLVFGIMTSVGYLFITICIMIGIIMGDFNGDEAPRFTLLLFNFFGFLFFVAIGSEQIHVYRNAESGKPTANGMGSMAIITSFIFLVDTVFTILDIRS